MKKLCFQGFVARSVCVLGWSLMAMLPLVLASCEKGYVAGEEEEKPINDDQVRVSFSVSGYDVIAFGQGGQRLAARRAKQDIKEVCTRISFALFDTDGKKVAMKNQAQKDDDFGTLSATVEKGTYQLVVVAYSSTDGNATISSPQEVKFSKNKLTDTFYSCGSFEIDEDAQYDIVLQRAVAMFRLNVADKTPTNVTQMKFYYTGGSSTLDATTGTGCVNSKQTELRTVEAAAYNGSSTYEVYTFPHADGKGLKMKVYALNAAGDTIVEREYLNVPVEVNKITECTTNFFDNVQSGSRSITFSVDAEWSGTISYGE